MDFTRPVIGQAPRALKTEVIVSWLSQMKNSDTAGSSRLELKPKPPQEHLLQEGKKGTEKKQKTQRSKLKSIKFLLFFCFLDTTIYM